MENQLGLKKYVALYSILGLTTPKESRTLIEWIIKQIGMDTADMEPMIWMYPIGHQGEMKGGVGFTLVQPITESVTYQDYWEEHRGYYVLIASCRKFSPTLLALKLAIFLRKKRHRLLKFDTCKGSLLKPKRVWWKRLLFGNS